MSKWFPLHSHTHYSLLDGLSRPKDIAARIEKEGFAGCAITDHGNVAGCIQFMKAMQKKKLKPILGCEFYLCADSPTVKSAENRKLSHLVVLAKNLDGWKQLLAATSASNRTDYVYYRPRLNLESLAEFCNGNLMSFSGHMGSDMADIFFLEPKLAYRAKTFDECKLLVDPDWKDKAIRLANFYQDVFGKGNFYLEVQLIDVNNLPAQDLVTRGLRWISRQTGIPCVATADSHYVNKADAADQRVLLCSALQTTLSSVNMKLANEEDVGLGAFFKSNNYHIPSYADMIAVGHTEEELENACNIAAQCEDYKLISQPILPKFECPNGMSADEYLRQLCRDGWKSKLKLQPDQVNIYADRIKQELGIFQEAGLAGYFLVVQDYMNWCRNQGWLTGPGRGSGAGCLVSYLIGITSIDPIEHQLFFERFYNAGRNTADRVSLPDIDCDFPVSKRPAVIEYIREKYGREYVSQMVTISRMQGRGALKDVLRVHDACSYDEMNRMTEFIPDEAEISDQLQAIREANDGEASIIRWALEHNSEQLKEWAALNDKGEVVGQMGPYFAQAIRLEGVKRSQGKHASGIVISAVPLSEVCPMIADKSSNDLVAGMEMNDLELLGHVKFDILGVSVLDKLMGVSSLLQTGKFE